MYLVNCALAKKPLAGLFYRNRNIYIYIERERERERDTHTHTHTHIVAEPGFNTREAKFL